MTNFLQQLYDWLILNWKSSVIGAVSSIALLLVNFGITLSPELQQQITGAITAAGLLLLGVVSKDGDEPNP